MKLCLVLPGHGVEVSEHPDEGGRAAVPLGDVVHGGAGRGEGRGRVVVAVAEPLHRRGHRQGAERLKVSGQNIWLGVFSIPSFFTNHPKLSPRNIGAGGALKGLHTGEARRISVKDLS